MPTVYQLFGASYNDAQLKVVTDAFDKAWEQIKSGYSDAEVAPARERLAKVILRIAPLGERDSTILAQSAVKMFYARGNESGGTH